MVVLVTGANGQLGQSIRFIAKIYPKVNFVFCNSQDLDISSKKEVKIVFDKFKPDFCINTAAYTAVDKAESEPKKARLVNVIGAKNIAETCKDFGTVLIHLSTDFVFDGNKTTPYIEEDMTNPQSVYGQTKLDGEKAIQDTFDSYFIIRTSWVYSQFGANFMKTILRLAKERTSLSVVNDQIGSPTNAIDLAEVLIKIICHAEYKPSDKTQNLFGIYNFSNEGQCSWYDFAEKIFENNKLEVDLQPISTSSYPTPAQRPQYSVLDKSKIKLFFGIEINHWKKSLEKNH